RGDRRTAHWSCSMRALTTIHETEGLDEYLEEIEQRLLDAVSCHPGLAATVGAEALAAGGKRLRPLLVFLAATPNRQPPYVRGAGLNRDEARELAEFGLALGIAFQIADDILDCTGETIDNGKIAGTDLREGTPTLPLLLAAREDPVVHRALAGGSLDGALVR